jgi:gliding motility-associated-like protein
MAQEAVHNFGTMQLHNTAAVGFHMDLINNGVFDNNLGLVGFYAMNNSLEVSGGNPTVFYDTEIAVDDGLVLRTAMGVTNNSNFIAGNVITPTLRTEVYLDYIDNSFYVGENSLAKIDGYAGITNKQDFTFPVGNEDRLRPLTIESVAVNTLAICAYFDQNPANAVSFIIDFDTTVVPSEDINASTVEFWRLEGSVSSQVTLTWDAWSNINVLSEEVEDIKVIGWSKADNQWIDLGNVSYSGDLTSGTVTSENFIPNDYEILTFGAAKAEEIIETVELDNYYLTPNGDGINDYLVLEGIENSKNNHLQIFNRYGALVYSKDNYSNEFNGISNRGLVTNRTAGLPSGIYFYIVTMEDLGKKHQGYMFITTNPK